MEANMDAFFGVFFAIDIAAFACMLLIYSSHRILCSRDAILLSCVPPCSVLLTFAPFLFIPYHVNEKAFTLTLLALIYSCIGYAMVWAVNKRRRSRGIAPAPMRYMIPAILVSGPVCFVLVSSIILGFSMLISPGY